MGRATRLPEGDQDPASKSLRSFISFHNDMLAVSNTGASQAVAGAFSNFRIKDKMYHRVGPLIADVRNAFRP